MKVSFISCLQTNMLHDKHANLLTSKFNCFRIYTDPVWRGACFVSVASMRGIDRTARNVRIPFGT
jgi:hypothetical protein